MAAKKQTGLGADAIFGTEQPPTTPAPGRGKAQPTPKADAIRTTVMMPPDVAVLLNRLKEQSILEGNRQTQGEIIADAIRTLAKLRNIEL